MIKVTFLPLGQTIALEPGETLLQGARRLIAPGQQALEAPCGGTGLCGQCRVRIIEGQPPSPTPAETEILTRDDLDMAWRLACQCAPAGDLKVLIPAVAMAPSSDLQIDDVLGSVAPDPLVRQIRISLRASTLGHPRSCWRQIEEALSQEHGITAPVTDLGLMTGRDPVAEDGPVSAIVQGSEVIDLTPADRAPRLLGLAVDLGSTKVAGYLVDLETGHPLAARGIMNPQIRFGADVVARIAHAQRGPRAAGQLRRSARECILHLCDTLAHDLGRHRNDIVHGVIVANTAMHHLLLGLPVAQLGTSPYMPALTCPLEVKARQLGLDLAPGAAFYITPPVAGYIGGDHIAMILAAGIHRSQGVVLGLDIGTNTELVLACNGKLWAASCASGPAFEGAGIRNGVRAVDGAIRQVCIAPNGNLICKTMGNTPAVGLCGSGVVDAVAALVQNKIINSVGTLDRSHDRVRIRPGGTEPEYLLVPPERSVLENGIALGQRDIGAIQLAKAAIAAGIAVLLDAAGLAADQIDKIIIAGAFGSHLDTGSATTIGLLPCLPSERTVQVGNAAGAGARMSLVSATCRKEAEAIARRINYLELASHPAFSSLFTRALPFPEPAP